MELYEIKEGGIYIGTIKDKSKVNKNNRELITLIASGDAPFLTIDSVMDSKAVNIGRDTLRGTEYDFTPIDISTNRAGINKLKIPKFSDNNGTTPQFELFDLYASDVIMSKDMIAYREITFKFPVSHQDYPKNNPDEILINAGKILKDSFLLKFNENSNIINENKPLAKEDGNKNVIIDNNVYNVIIDTPSLQTDLDVKESEWLPLPYKGGLPKGDYQTMFIAGKDVVFRLSDCRVLDDVITFINAEYFDSKK